MRNINDTYFDGFYKDIWKAIIPTELTTKEVDFMMQYFNLQPGMRVLDLMCGYGRHSIALAEKGIEVVAVDNLNDYINEIKEQSKIHNLPITPIKTNIIDYSSDKTFDLIICMGNSLNFFDAQNIELILTKISSCLDHSGYFLINTWSIAEIIFKSFQENGWSQIGNKKFLTSSKFLFHPTRIETDHFIIDDNKTTETKKSIDYIYSISELDAHFEKTGLNCKEIYSIPGRKKFTLGDPRAYIIAQKKSNQS
jgi:SAM-dependent methyltransferase